VAEVCILIRFTSPNAGMAWLIASLVLLCWFYQMLTILVLTMASRANYDMGLNLAVLSFLPSQYLKAYQSFCGHGITEWYYRKTVHLT
jgi:hypothetical protein